MLSFIISAIIGLMMVSSECVCVPHSDVQNSVGLTLVAWSHVEMEVSVDASTGDLTTEDDSGRVAVESLLAVAVEGVKVVREAVDG